MQTSFNNSNNFYSPNYNPNDTFSEEDELPILEELGINLTHIWKKTLSVLNPFRKIDEESLKDNDLAGPLFFALLLGMFLLLVCLFCLLLKQSVLQSNIREKNKN